MQITKHRPNSLSGAPLEPAGAAVPHHGRLLVISSASVQAEGDTLRLDGKFLEGMRLYCSLWNGPVECVLFEARSAIPFGTDCTRTDLPFGLRILAPGEGITAKDVAEFDVILCSGDNHKYFDLADICAGLPTRLYYIIEYILETRLQIIFLQQKITILQKFRSAFWALRQERRRRQAFRKAHGLQANGYPAAAAYRPLNSNTLLYLDNRISADMLALDTEMTARQDHLSRGGRLRLLHSGRLEPMKGAQDLVPVAAQLKRAGVDFELNIFGTGSLETAIREGVQREGLQDCVFLHGVVDFSTELVPFARRKADVFLSCHRQSDPSCTYVESMGCGLAIVGYRNRMWEALCAESSAGWVAPLGDVDALASTLIALAAKPSEIVQRCGAARNFARAHLFQTEFGRRLAQLSGVPA